MCCLNVSVNFRSARLLQSQITDQWQEGMEVHVQTGKRQWFEYR